MKRFWIFVVLAALVVGYVSTAFYATLREPPLGHMTREEAVAVLARLDTSIRKCRPDLYAATSDRTVSGFVRKSASLLGVSDHDATTDARAFLGRISDAACQ